ncbi:MAG: hypothetical protein GY845_06170 [Planctomycetes bacterium]|nr:hypothetical protein [Planctomycetota bacterium]
MREARVGQPITIGEITVVPLEIVMVFKVDNDSGHSLYFSLTPIGVALRTSQKRWAIDIDGNDVPLENYLQEFDTLGQVLDNL